MLNKCLCLWFQKTIFYPENWEWASHTRNIKLLAIYSRFEPFDDIFVWDIESGEEVSYQDG